MKIYSPMAFTLLSLYMAMISRQTSINWLPLAGHTTTTVVVLGEKIVVEDCSVKVPVAEECALEIVVPGVSIGATPLTLWSP